jgi:hypothetical protein
MADAVLVVNLAEINRSINASGKEYAKAMHIGLLQGAEPVRQDAGRLSQTALSGMRRARKKPPPWSIQKKGQTIHEVYIVPTQKGVGRGHADDPRRRPNFATVMLGKAYNPALERNRARVVAHVEYWMGSVTRTI